MKLFRLAISILIALQITAFTMGIFYSNQVCREGIMSFSETISRDKKDKIALIVSILMYHGFYLGAKTIDMFLDCGKVYKKQTEQY